ncbi:MAG: hypothetical protein J7502_00860 [Flavisolibacter sp.]|nr:hypothetical protein [Flavisolibacter sp.]
MNPYFLQKAFFRICLIKKPEVKWGLKKKFPGVLFLPHMSWKEFKFFKEVCSNKKVILEYGSGGSTIWLLKKNKKIYSVESNPDFYEYMNSIKLVKRSVDKLQYRFIDLGPTNDWGKPLTTTHSNDWPAYYSEIWNDIDATSNKVDIVFIDGRFRVSCCLYTILKVLEYRWQDTVFLFHDFWRRKKYHEVLEFLQEIKSAEQLAAFKIKDHINIEKVKERLKEYALDFA